MVALDLALALAFGVLLNLDLGARLVTLAGMDSALSKKNLGTKNRINLKNFLAQVTLFDRLRFVDFLK